MRTTRYLPKVRNGAVAKRQTRSKNPATSKAFGAFSVGAGIPRPRDPRQRHPRPNSMRVSTRAGNRRRSEGHGAKVIWLMILIGMIITAGFVFALRSQISAHKIAQAEEQLKMKLDEYTSRQQFLTLDQQRALSAGESARAGRRNGLDHLKLDREATPNNASVQRLVYQVPSPVRAPQANQRDRLATNVKTEKTAKVVKVVKLNAVKSSGAANNARTNVVRTRKRQ